MKRIKIRNRYFNVVEIFWAFNETNNRWMKIARLDTGRTTILGASLTRGGKLIKKKKRKYKFK